MKQVPEKRTVPSMEEQLLWLRDHLTGHEAFARQRGKNYSPLEDVVSEAKSPRNFNRLWREKAADFMVIGHLLAKLHRDGWEFAEKELWHALGDEQYIIYGETVPLDKMRDVTLVVGDFPRILDIFRWFSVGEPSDLWNFAKGDRTQIRHLAPVSKLFEVFPDLMHRFERSLGRDDLRSWELMDATKETVAPVKTILNNYGSYDKTPFRFCERGCMNDFGYTVERSFWLFKLIIAKQGDVLSKLPRAEQEKVSTWHIQIPAAWRYHSYIKFMIGLHPEADHEYWSRRVGMFASTGFSQGYGTVIFRYEESPAAEEYFTRYGLDTRFNWPKEKIWEVPEPPVVLLEEARE